LSADGRGTGTPVQRRQTSAFFAVAPPGLEGILLGEMRDLGLPSLRQEDGGVSFSGGERELHRANLFLRTASRVLVRMSKFRATAFHELERYAMKVPWENHVTRGGPVELRVTCRKSKLYHSGAVAERVAGAIAKRTGAVVVAGLQGAQADEEAAAPGAEPGSRTPAAHEGAQMFVVRIFRDECVVSADSSGAHLHMRGYREAVGKAPIRETLAAALVRGSGWDRATPLVDPMCGSGTIAIEAALMARKIAAGLSRASRDARAYAFERWPGHDSISWKEEIDRARAMIIEASPSSILASDRDEGAIAATFENAVRAGVDRDLGLAQQTISEVAFGD
jgi:putative N6-adenine-specific DNA methylase